MIKHFTILFQLKPPGLKMRVQIPRGKTFLLGCTNNQQESVWLWSLITNNGYRVLSSPRALLDACPALFLTFTTCKVSLTITDREMEA